MCRGFGGIPCHQINLFLKRPELSTFRFVELVFLSAVMERGMEAGMEEGVEGREAGRQGGREQGGKEGNREGIEREGRKSWRWRAR